MDSNKNTARLAGFLWVLAAGTSGFGLVYARPKLMVPGDAAATVKNLLAMDSLFRESIAASIVSAVFMVFFGLAIYEIFRAAQKKLSLVFLVSLLMAAGIAAVNSFSQLAVLVVLGKADFMKAFQPEQVNALAMVFLRMNNYGLGVTELFVALYLFSLGLLIFRTGYVPKVLGILLMIGACAFPVNTFTKILVPQFYPVLMTQMTMALNALGSPLTMLWLLIKGVRDPAPMAQVRTMGTR